MTIGTNSVDFEKGVEAQVDSYEAFLVPIHLNKTPKKMLKICKSLI